MNTFMGQVKDGKKPDDFDSDSAPKTADIVIWEKKRDALTLTKQNTWATLY